MDFTFTFTAGKIERQTHRQAAGGIGRKTKVRRIMRGHQWGLQHHLKHFFKGNYSNVLID